MNSWLNIEGVRMTRSFVRVYSEEAELKTDERKRLYKELMEKDVFGERGKNFPRALKRLVFDGELESYEPFLECEDELGGYRQNDLSEMLAVYICLAAPCLDLDFYKAILRRYECLLIINMSDCAISYVDGSSSASLTFMRKIGFFIEAADDVLSEGGYLLALEGNSFVKMFSGFFSKVCYEGNGNNCLFPRFFSRFDSLCSAILGRHKKYMEVTSEGSISMLFGSAAVDAGGYSDEAFKFFFRQYVNREFTPALLEYLDAVYYSIPEEKRIRLDGDKISYFAD
ncbi:hypothetical protein [Metapseudomonas otitidis]|uniref:hypothetical protein n=1 Tax=Metapseudomonas otitidis TaxID=319939 RepID=UPI00280A6099|nr:hypothetical protein [Pseudomonas otitidis]